MPSPMGRVVERQRNRERFLPLPSALRAATFPKGEGLLLIFPNDGFYQTDQFRFPAVNGLIGLIFRQQPNFAVFSA